MKNYIKYFLQRTLGINRYLFIFSRFKIHSLKYDKKEKDFFHFLSLLSNKNGDILDIGANIGIMSYHLAKRFPKNNIHAFEPIPCNLKVLKRIKERYNLNKVIIHSFALGNSTESIEMILPKEKGAIQQGLSHVKHKDISEWNNGEQIQVEQKKLDDIFKEKQIDGIKIDVENYEYLTLKGAEKVIKKNLPIIYCELWDNENRVKCFDFMKSIEYEIYVLFNKQLCIFDASKHEKQNFFFLPKSSQ